MISPHTMTATTLVGARAAPRTQTVEGVDERARADATPAEEEITRIRRLISKIKDDITQLTDIERAAVDDAVAVIRRHRSACSPVSLGMPAFRTPLPSPRTESLA
jgi:hypothetical protein